MPRWTDRQANKMQKHFSTLLKSIKENPLPLPQNVATKCMYYKIVNYTFFQHKNPILFKGYLQLKLIRKKKIKTVQMASFWEIILSS